MHHVMRVQAGRLVHNGEAFLDQVAATGHEIVPVDWHRAINLKILDVSKPIRCVLAQLGHASRHSLLHYEPVALALGMEPHPLDASGEAFQRGFAVLPDEHAPEGYHYLTLAWKWVILRRILADDPPRIRMALAS